MSDFDVLIARIIAVWVDVEWNSPPIPRNPVNQLSGRIKFPCANMLKASPFQETYLLWRSQASTLTFL